MRFSMGKTFLSSILDLDSEVKVIGNFGHHIVVQPSSYAQKYRDQMIEVTFHRSLLNRWNNLSHFPRWLYLNSGRVTLSMLTNSHLDKR